MIFYFKTADYCCDLRYGPAVSELVERLRPHSHEVNRWLWTVLHAAERALLAEGEEEEGEGAEEDGSAPADGNQAVKGAARSNLRALTKCCLKRYVFFMQKGGALFPMRFH